MSIKLTEEEVRIIGLSAPQLYKMLHAREERILNKMYGEFRAGKTDQILTLAEWASVRDQLNEITNVLNQHNKQETKKHANPNS